MTRIEIYDCDAKEIWEIADRNGIMPSDVVEELLRAYLQEFVDSRNM